MKLQRKIGHRKSLIKNLATSLILYEKIKTTKAKAKLFVPYAEKMINVAKKGSLSSRRKLLGFFKTKSAVSKMLEVIAPRYLDRNSGYIRIYRISSRAGDNAAQVLVQLVESVKLIKAVTESPKTEKTKENKKDEKIKPKTEIKRARKKSS